MAKYIIDIDEEDYDNICKVGGLVLPRDILYVFRGATPLEEILEDIKAEIGDAYADRPSSYCHGQRVEFYRKVIEVIDKHISGKEKE